MIKRISAFLLIVFISGCAGRAANPVMIRQFGDENRSCASLMTEMTSIENEIQTLIPKTNKTGKNVALGVAGWFFLVPWFFMDLSQAEQEEINAYRMRYNSLLIIASEKGCGSDKEQIPDFKTMKTLPRFMQKKTDAPSSSDASKPEEKAAEPASNNFAASK